MPLSNSLNCKKCLLARLPGMFRLPKSSYNRRAPIRYSHADCGTVGSGFEFQLRHGCLCCNPSLLCDVGFTLAVIAVNQLQYIKIMPYRKSNLGRNTRKVKSVQRVIAHQTEEEWASENEQSRQRMAQIRAVEATEQRATRLED
ncbi:hypothetical protein TNCV_1564831 [Trichonephila clavipes]|nr:hypothetical protein TNCV_1564831 [Trichonephila clavipes]